MEFDQLRTFLAVLEHKSFVRAGQALHVGQSTVSFHIKALEQRAGSILLERGRGNVEPTPAGRILQPYAERIVALVDEAAARLRAGEEGEVGRLVIAASTIPGEYILPAILAEHRARHPRIRIEMTVSDSEKASSAVLAKEADVALVGSKPRDRRLAASVFASDEIVLVGLKSTPLAPHGKLTLKELRGVPLILREQGSGTRDAIARILPHVTAEGEGAVALRVGSTEAAKRCVQHGLGLAFVSRQAVAAELAAGLFQVVDVPGTPARRTFYVVRHRGVTPSAPLRSFLELVNQRTRSSSA
jgi:DNA-binding transcriptional LysR family regulator